MSFLKSIMVQFRHYKELAEKAMAQLSDVALLREADGDNNSIVVIVKHMHGNMLSRWTNFLTEDGEKPWRQRDAEFNHETLTRPDLLYRWEEGWACVFDALAMLGESDLSRTIYIRGEAMTATDGITRQLAHYCYHVGQIVYIAKERAADFTSLSIPKGATADYNARLLAATQRPL